MKQNIIEEDNNKKLDALDEYFRINRYENNSYIYTSGAVLNSSDIKNNINIRSGVIKSNILGDLIVYNTGFVKSSFIDYVSNMNNHYKENLSMLTEEEKQKIYLTYHDEIPWNSIILCNQNTIYFNNESCNTYFNLVEDDIIYYNDNYYILCPNCYNLSLINKELLSDSVKLRIKNKSLENKNIYREIFHKREYLVNEKKDKKLLKK